MGLLGLFDKMRDPRWNEWDPDDDTKFDTPSDGPMEDWLRAGSLMANLFFMFGVPAAFIWFIGMVIYYGFATTSGFDNGIVESIKLLHLMFTHWFTYICFAFFLWIVTVIYSVAKREA